MRRRWQDSELSNIESRVRQEGVLTGARVLCAAVSIAAAYSDLGEPTASTAFIYQVLVGYLILSGAFAAAMRLAPGCLRYSSWPGHAVDLTILASLTVFAPTAAGAFIVTFLFVLAAATARWGPRAAILTATIGVVLYVTGTLGPLSRADATELADRTLLRAMWFLLFASVIAWILSSQRTLQAERTVLSRVVTAIGSSLSFGAALRAFTSECLARFGGSTVLVVVENHASRRMYLWSSSRDLTHTRGTLALEELPGYTRQIYFAPAPGDISTWYARRHKTRVAGWALGLPVWSGRHRIDGAFATPILARHGVESVLAADWMAGEEWRVRFMLLDPSPAGTEDLAFLRRLATAAAPALYNHYLVRRVRADVRASERAQLARDLHDTVLQSLIGLEMELEVMRRQANDRAISERRLRHARDQLRMDIAEVRDLMLGLRLNEIGSRDALRIIAELIARLRRESDVEVRLISSAGALDCPPRLCGHLVRIVQEALANVRKHSGARSVTITLAQNDHDGRLIIEDDGRGFHFRGRMTLEQLEAIELGPAAIKERVRAMGGRLVIESRPRLGTRIEVEWSREAYA